MMLAYRLVRLIETHSDALATGLLRKVENCEFTQKKTGKTIRWITKVDEKRMWADFLAKLDRHNRAAGVF